MSSQVQFRRGTTTQNNAFTGAQGEITYDTDVKTLRLHDGSTAGGGATVVTLAASQSLTNKTMSTGSVWSGNAVALSYGGTGSSLTAAAGAIAYSTSGGLALNSPGASGQILQSAGTGTPIWVNASALTTGTATNSTNATNLAGGSAGYLPYQSDTNTTAFIAPGTSGYLLQSTGASTAPSWVVPTITFGSTTLTLGNTTTAIDGVSTFYITGTTDSSSDSTGVLRVAGGASIKKKLYVGSDLNVTGNTVITGNLTVNGTTTTVNSTTLTVDDKNIELGSVATPTDTTANGGGITLKGDTDKTINWDSANSNWTSSEHWNIASGKSFKIATVPVLTSTTVLNDSSQTSIGIGGYATTISMGASTGTTTINHDLGVNGGDIVTTATTFNLLNANATTVTAFGAATALTLGASTGTLTVKNAQTVFDSTKSIQLPVGTTAERPTAATGQVRYNSDLSTFEGYGSSAWGSLGGVKSVDGFTYILAETSAGASNGDLDFYAENGAGNAASQIGQWNRTNLKDYTGTIVGTQTTQNVFNATATTVNAFGASTTTAIGSTSSGTTTIGYDANIKHDLTVDGDVQIKGGDLTTNQTTFNLLNTTATTLNIGGAATTIGIGASTGTLTVNNTATIFNSTSNIKLPVGDSSQRPGTPSAGMVRYNSEISSFEGYASGAWSSLGGVKSVDGLTYILAETSAGASNDELEFYTATDASNTAKRGGWNKTRLLVNTPILVSSQASLTEYPNALIISANGDTTNNEPYIVGVVGEGVASGSDSTQWGVGIYGVGTSAGSTKSAGVIGRGHVTNTSDTGSSVGMRAYSTDTHASGLNVGYYAEASGSSTGNYALWMEAGNIMSNGSQTWTLYDNQSSALSLGSTGKADIVKVITTDGAEGVTMSGTLGVTGDFKVNTNKFTVTASSGDTLVAGALTVTGDAAINGGDITTTSTTATLFNTNATTLNVGGAATTLNIGSSGSGAAVNVGKDLYVAGNLYVTGTQSTGSIATVSGADSVVYVNAGATGNTKEIGIIGEYKPAGTTLYTGLLKDHTDSTWKFYSAPTSNPSAGTTQDFTGATYDPVKMGALTSTTGTFSTALNSTGDFKVNTNKFVVTASSGNTTVAGTLGVTGDVAVNTNKFTVAASTGNTVVAGTLSVTGHPTLEGVTATGATGTGALVFATSPSLTTPTLGVASATTINKVTITAPATGSTLTVADGKTLTASNSLTFTGTDGSSVAFGAGGTAAYTTDVHYIGTTSVALNRASANLALTGISSVTLPGSTSGTVQIVPTAAVGTGTVLTIPATTGTIITTGDSGTVTNTMLAGSIANAKLSNSTISGVSLGSNLNALTISSPLSGTSYNGSSAVTIALATGYGDTQNPYASKTANYFLAAPNGSAGAPTFRAIVAADIPTLNQSTTGSAATLTTPRAIYGNNFDGSAALTQIIASTYGGTGNGFTKFSGATTAEKTYTLPDATCTILTSNAAVTAAQGGTGQTSYTVGDILYASTTTALSKLAAGTSGYALVSGGAGVAPSWSAISISSSANQQLASLGVGTAASGTSGEIRATSQITAYYSDDRLKTRTGNIQNALEKVLSLDGFHYHANETAVALGYDASKQEVGLSAQQVQAVLPEVIAPAPIDPQYMTMHYERLVPLLVEAIKEQQKQIEELKAKLGN